ncbi:Pectin acetylesterase [Rhynchospora pubera]|uniref:Pectin acetylesterase n=1 Tax=Rhynchospora pubera TaxID=906938 RepID=A0AAV8GC51_9POAL|nr:Pectin acetylesterase [Rhynchospora pubera]
MATNQLELFLVLVVTAIALKPRRCLCLAQQESLLVGMTLLPNATLNGAMCLDGSPPAYHLHKGFGAGANNWLLQVEGGGWCNTVRSCRDRATTRRGSTRYMSRFKVFSGILIDDPLMNPDFYNWNRVKLRYCDGGSFAGDSEFQTLNKTIYLRGQKIWTAIIDDLLNKGLNHAAKVLLSGCSAGGLAVFHHCDQLAQLLPEAKSVKCLSDAGFFVDLTDISGSNTIRPFFGSLVSLQGISKFLNKKCVASYGDPLTCFFPQYAIRYISSPFFIVNPAYDMYQFTHCFVPPSSDPSCQWSKCKLNQDECSATQIEVLQGLRNQTLKALEPFNLSTGGRFINSCLAHCQSELPDSWFAPDSPRLGNKTIAEAVGDWYFERKIVSETDCPYPCDSTCRNLPSKNQDQGSNNSINIPGSFSTVYFLITVLLVIIV